ncbi:MAG: hypothetical protein Q8P71_00225 [bacterium]|nr:hypothetical protein [bacterium]
MYISQVKGRVKDANQSGMAVLLVVLFLSALSFSIVMAIAFTSANQHRMAESLRASLQARYSAEAGAEDAMLRIKKEMQWVSPYVITFPEGRVDVSVSGILGGARTITAQGENKDRVRVVQIKFGLSSTKTSFFYGAQVGNGGMAMRSGSRVIGNVFSNGSVEGTSSGSRGEITDTVMVAQNGNLIRNLIVGMNAYAYSCDNSNITGTLTIIAGGTLAGCNAGVLDQQLNEILPKEFAVSGEMIESWKEDAETGEVIVGDYTIANNDQVTLGPVKIDGNFHIGNSAQLIVTGTIWVTGTFDSGPNAIIRLNEESYGDLSGVFIVEGTARIRNGIDLRGTDSPGSYMLFVGTSSSMAESSPAIEVNNNVSGDMMFSPNGLLLINNNVNLVGVTGNRLILNNNVEITYEVGLANLSFTSGPGAGWQLLSWKEVE